MNRLKQLVILIRQKIKIVFQSVVDGFVDDFMTDFEDLFVDRLLNTWSDREIEHAYKSQRLFEANMDRIIEGDCYKYEINNLS